jgi:hypothetical protein
MKSRITPLTGNRTNDPMSASPRVEQLQAGDALTETDSINIIIVTVSIINITFFIAPPDYILIIIIVFVIFIEVIIIILLNLTFFTLHALLDVAVVLLRVYSCGCIIADDFVRENQEYLSDSQQAKQYSNNRDY